jgi:hypothetical protein
LEYLHLSTVRAAVPVLKVLQAAKRSGLRLYRCDFPLIGSALGDYQQGR